MKCIRTSIRLSFPACRGQSEEVHDRNEGSAPFGFFRNEKRVRNFPGNRFLKNR